MPLLDAGGLPTDALNISGDEDGDEGVMACVGDTWLLATEDRAMGAVGWPVYIEYAKNAGGLPSTIFIVLLFGAAQALMATSSWWLSYWGVFLWSVACL